MAKAHGEVLRGVREGICTSCGTPRAELVHLRFAPDADIRRCSECGSETPLEILVLAPPSEVRPGTDQIRTARVALSSCARAATCSSNSPGPLPLPASSRFTGTSTSWSSPPAEAALEQQTPLRQQSAPSCS